MPPFILVGDLLTPLPAVSIQYSCTWSVCVWQKFCHWKMGRLECLASSVFIKAVCLWFCTWLSHGADDALCRLCVDWGTGTWADEWRQVIQDRIVCLFYPEHNYNHAIGFCVILRKSCSRLSYVIRQDCVLCSVPILRVTSDYEAWFCAQVSPQCCKKLQESVENCVLWHAVMDFFPLLRIVSNHWEFLVMPHFVKQVDGYVGVLFVFVFTFVMFLKLGLRSWSLHVQRVISFNVGLASCSLLFDFGVWTEELCSLLWCCLLWCTLFSITDNSCFEQSFSKVQN